MPGYLSDVVSNGNLVKASGKICRQILFQLSRALAHLFAAYVFLVHRIVKIAAKIADYLPLYLVKRLFQVSGISLSNSPVIDTAAVYTLHPAAVCHRKLSAASLAAMLQDLHFSSLQR